MDTPLEIVLVEDHDQLRRLTTAVLRARGHRVVALASAEEVDDSVTLSKPDIFILDLNLPGEDGVSLSRRIRAAQPRVGIIMTTVRREVEQRLVGYESGADAYLGKPTDVEELSAAVEALGRRVRDPLGAGLLGKGPEGEPLADLPGQAELFERPAGMPRLTEPVTVPTPLALVTSICLAFRSWAPFAPRTFRSPRPGCSAPLPGPMIGSWSAGRLPPCWARARISVWPAWRFGWVGCAKSWSRPAGRPAPFGHCGAWAIGFAFERW